ncbi:unnamed protein product, partial [Rotaria socialis]
QRAPSNEPEVSLESQKNQPTNPSDNNYQKASLNKQQGDKITRDYPKTMVPFVPQANKAANPWQQPRFQQPYFSNPMLQQQQQQQHQQQQQQQQQHQQQKQQPHQQHP